MIEDDLQINHDDVDELLVEEIKKHRLLWDTAHKDYKDANKKILSWSKIALKLNKPGGVKELKRRWKNLRDGLVRSIRKNNEASQIANSEVKVSKCKLFDELLFLKDFIANRPTPIEIPFGCSEQTPEVYKSVDIETHVLPEQETFNATIISFDKNTKRDHEASLEGGEEESEECEQSKRLKVASSPPASNSNNNSVLKLNEDVLSLTASSSGGLENNEITRSGNWYFCQSLVDVLDSLPKKKNRLAKIKIQEILMKLEFEEED